MTIRTALLLAITGSALALSGCGGAGEGNQATGGAAGSVAAVPAPQGTQWSEQVALTPEGGYRMGNPDAPIKVIEYASFTCPHCADFAEKADEPLRQNFVNSGKVSFEFRNLIRDPLDLTTAIVARCGGPEPFFPLTHQLFANQEAMFTSLQSQGEAAFKNAMSLPPEQRFVRLAEQAGLVEFAKERGIPEDKLRTCLADAKAAEQIAKGNELATSKFNVEGTPTLIMNGAKLDEVNTWPQLETRLKEAGA